MKLAATGTIRAKNANATGGVTGRIEVFGKTVKLTESAALTTGDAARGGFIEPAEVACRERAR